MFKKINHILILISNYFNWMLSPSLSGPGAQLFTPRREKVKWVAAVASDGKVRPKATGKMATRRSTNSINTASDRDLLGSSSSNSSTSSNPSTSSNANGLCSSNSAVNPNSSGSCLVDPLRELFEACRNGEVSKVKKLVSPQNVNARDTAGRKSSPLHFAAGKNIPSLLNLPDSIFWHFPFLQDLVVEMWWST